MTKRKTDLTKDAIKAQRLEAQEERRKNEIFELHEKITGHLFPAWTKEDERFLALALCGEVGELANLIKKRWRDGLDLSSEIRGEIYDVRIYLELLAKCFRCAGEAMDHGVEAKLMQVAERQRRKLEAAA